MNFFEHQQAARRTTSRLIGLFVLAVLAIVIAVDLAVLVVVGSRTADPQVLTATLAMATLLTLGLIGLGSLYRVAMLSGGGGDSIALQLGGVPVPERSDDLQYRRLRNVVEEMAIAAGVPMPRLYVLEHEAGINAFAAGWSPSDAAVGVTRGALERLNRDELQAVVAHEFSHILNGDMRLNLRLIGVLFGILMLALVGQKILEHGRWSSREKGAGAVMGLALAAMLIGYVGLFFGRLIKAGVSRSREFLADAAAVQFTRQSAGLAGALKKIGGLSAGAKLNHAGEAEEVSHMLFGDGVGFDGMRFGDWFATHPPLVERIRALDPSFRADQWPQLRERWAAQPPVGIEEDVRLGLAPPAALPAAATTLQVAPATVAAQVGTPDAADYRRADAIAAGLPEDVRALAAGRDDAIPLILGLLLDVQPRVQQRQMEEITARLGRPVAELAHWIQQQHLHGLHPMLRLPLATLAFPVLRRTAGHRACRGAHRRTGLRVRILPGQPAGDLSARIAGARAAHAVRPAQAGRHAPRGGAAAVAGGPGRARRRDRRAARLQRRAAAHPAARPYRLRPARRRHARAGCGVAGAGCTRPAGQGASGGSPRHRDRSRRRHARGRGRIAAHCVRRAALPLAAGAGAGMTHRRSDFRGHRMHTPATPCRA